MDRGPVPATRSRAARVGFHVVVAGAALFPLLGPLSGGGPNVGLAFTLFWVMGVLGLGRRLPLPAASTRAALGAKVFLAALAFGYALEAFAYLSKMPEELAAVETLLFDRRPGQNFALAFGFYASWAAAWTLLLQRYRFTRWQVVATAGAFGALIADRFMVLRLLLGGNPFGLLLIPFYGLVFGGTIGSAFSVVERDVSDRQLPGPRRKYLVGVALQLAAMAAVMPVWERLLPALLG